MISLNTDCGRIATVFTSIIFFFSSVCLFLPNHLLAQQVEPSVPQAPLTVDEALAPPDPDSATEPDVPDLDVLMRGPMHEAFAAAQQANPESPPLVKKEPPQSIEEVPPEYKPEGTNVQWIPGYWAWDVGQSDFIWISGVWRDIPPGRRWVPGYWEQTDGGYRWMSGFWAEEGAEKLGYLPEPPASVDRGPSTAAPGENYFYVPGNWDYHNGSYRWLSGHWQPIVKYWIWIPAHYIWTPRGCLYVPGYWDYEIASRGTCFAPVYFRRPIYTAYHYHYTPSCVVNINFNFLTHLFVRKGCGHYYYGNWYGRHFAGYGYTPWVKYHSHRRFHDPHLNYYRCRRSVYDSRYNVVQWSARQHDFYAKHEYYRPRSTYSAHVKSVAKSKHKQHHDYLRRAGYVSTYKDVLTKSRQPNPNGHKVARTDVDKLKQVAELRRQKFKKVEQQERLRNKKGTEYLAELQKHRRRTEFTSANFDRKSAKQIAERKTRSLRIPITENGGDNPAARRNPRNFDLSSQKKIENQITQNQKKAELQRAIEKARRDAATKTRQQQLQREPHSKIVQQDQIRQRQKADLQRRQQLEKQRLADADRVSRLNKRPPIVPQNLKPQQQRFHDQGRKFQEPINTADNRRHQQQQFDRQKQQQRSDQLRRQQEQLRQNQLRAKQAQQQDRLRRTQQEANRVRESQQNELARRARDQARQNSAQRTAMQSKQQQQLVQRQQQQQRLQQQTKQAQQQREQLRRAQDAAERKQQMQQKELARRAQDQARRNAAQRAAAQRAAAQQRQQQMQSKQQQQRKQQQIKRNTRTR